MDKELKLTRRKFLQVSAAAGAVAAAGGIELAAHASLRLMPRRMKRRKRVN